uniref:snRNA-activating protein complex subunit 3 n=1 Tax=Pavo cristatus TaxID=9049 RepID=A0A8C9G0G9_PAVCR
AEVVGPSKTARLSCLCKCDSELLLCGQRGGTEVKLPVLFCFSQDLYKSASFSFESIFCNDRRYPECKDLSKTTTEWSESHDRGYGNLQSVKVEDYAFNDLSLKISFP